MRDMPKKLTERQKTILVKFVKKYPVLYNGKYSSAFTSIDAKNKWLEISNVLNSLPGPSKDWKTWRKTWHDLRTKCKSKFYNLKKHAGGTVEDPPPELEATPTELEILKTISPTTLLGNDPVEKSTTERTEEELTDDTINNIKIEFQEEQSLSRGVSSESKDNFNTHAAVSSYQKMLEKKLKIKELYYKKLLQLKEDKNQLLRERNKILMENNKFLEHNKIALNRIANAIHEYNQSKG